MAAYIIVSMMHGHTSSKYYTCYVVELSQEHCDWRKVHLQDTQSQVNAVVEEGRKINQENVIRLINFVRGEVCENLIWVSWITRVSTFTDGDDRHLVPITPWLFTRLCCRLLWNMLLRIEGMCSDYDNKCLRLSLASPRTMSKRAYRKVIMCHKTVCTPCLN